MKQKSRVIGPLLSKLQNSKSNHWIFEEAGYASEIAARAQKNGVLFSSLNDKILTLFPALNIDRKTAEEGWISLKRVLDNGWVIL